jgi:4'-phosphopantetheinyl transferase
MDYLGAPLAAHREELDLSRGELHLWSADLDRPDFELGVAEELLSPDELDRASRFYLDRDRRRFVVGRGLLRIILARYLQCDADALQFAYGADGKPALLDQTADLQFSVAHSSRVGVVAVVSERLVGVDVERVRDLPDADRVAARIFSEPEARIVHALPYPAKIAAFFACWTRKEAYVKALGAGVACPLDSFAVSCQPFEEPRLTWVADDPQEAELWSFYSFSPAEAYTAAVVVEGPQPPQCRWRAVGAYTAARSQPPKTETQRTFR